MFPRKRDVSAVVTYLSAVEFSESLHSSQSNDHGDPGMILTQSFIIYKLNAILFTHWLNLTISAHTDIHDIKL